MYKHYLWSHVLWCHKVDVVAVAKVLQLDDPVSKLRPCQLEPCRHIPHTAYVNVVHPIFFLGRAISRLACCPLRYGIALLEHVTYVSPCQINREIILAAPDLFWLMSQFWQNTQRRLHMEKKTVPLPFQPCAVSSRNA
jgi:hypothetical protein